MKYVAIVLTVLTVLALGFSGYVVYTSNAQITDIGYQVALAADQEALFSDVRASVEDRLENVVVLNEDVDLSNLQDYVLVTYSITLKNRDILPYEWFDISLTGKDGDVAYLKSDMPDIPAHEENTVTLTLLTSRERIDYSREIKIDYFFYANEKSVTLTAGA
ncbi:MAG: hypothetical protein IJJ23_06865 [Clostridia bacterium]|nr:hypothetical protein [Clostridia bacterium]